MSTTERPARLHLVRHGETSANLDGVWHGSTDTALTDKGHGQAARTAEHIAGAYADVTAIYCSDLQRTRHTAGPIASALGLELRPDPTLREYDLGRWEGKTYRELMSEHRLWDHMRDDPHYAPHGGESPLGVAERVADAFRRIDAAHEGERVVVVTHGGALSLALALLLDGNYGNWGRVMDNCAITELVLRPEPNIVRFNETSHLDPTDAGA